MTRTALNLCAFLKENVTAGIDSLDEARRFACWVDLSEEDRLFIQAALSSERALREFDRQVVQPRLSPDETVALKVRTAPRKPHHVRARRHV